MMAKPCIMPPTRPTTALRYCQKCWNTSDFYHFRDFPNAWRDCAEYKGMALFPRKVKGKYAMLCRLDGVNNYIAYSDQLTVWREAKLLQEPKYPWEFVQIGNCGSPIETADGWLVITHGVGCDAGVCAGRRTF
jgi:predicted GH43/DUF377 family glycosyl hydrolase